MYLFLSCTELQIGRSAASSNFIADIFYSLYAKGRSGIEVELMAREEEGENVDACCDPAVVCILRITTIHHVVKIIQRGEFLLSQREILHQCYAPDIEEHSHEKLRGRIN